jgi:O-acetyl-ADP-ribose deacetylase (regulator of RNase III)
MRVQILQGDITNQYADVIVSSLSPTACGEAGVERDIAKRAGGVVLEACRRLNPLLRSSPSGTTVSTHAGRLPARWVVHVQGPDYDVGADPFLARAYRNALATAASLGATTIALPSLSTGRRAYPLLRAAQIAVRAARQAPFDLDEVRFVLKSNASYRAFMRAAALEG